MSNAFEAVLEATKKSKQDIVFMYVEERYYTYDYSSQLLHHSPIHVDE